LRIEIGLLDTGVDISHPKLEESFDQYISMDRDGLIQIKGGYCNPHSHGTHMAQILVQHLKDESRPLKTRLNIVSIPQTGSVILNLLRGMDWLLDWKLSVICMPIGIKGKTPIFKPLLDEFEKRNTLVVAPVGNGGDGKIHSPGWYPNVLSVGAVDDAGQPARFSGSYYAKDGTCLKPDIMAPGVDIQLASSENKMRKMSGTSVSCASVAGIAAKLLEKETHLHAVELKTRLIESAEPMPQLPNRHYNYQKRIANLENALAGKVIQPDAPQEQPDDVFEQQYIDPFFQKKYAHAHADTELKSIIAFRAPSNLTTADNSLAIQEEFTKNRWNDKIRDIAY